MRVFLIALFLYVCPWIGLIGCASTSPSVTPITVVETMPIEPAPVVSPEDQALARDRAAILSLAGVYEVTFRYEEVAALRSGYELAAPQRSSAREWIFVVEDQGDRIVLQHLLLIGEPALVVKHWRQDWQHAPATALQYVDAQIWRHGAFALAGMPGVWTRSVMEVDDGPAYTNWGRWSHAETMNAESNYTTAPDTQGSPVSNTANGIGSIWTSVTPVLAPLPRREASRQNDYEVLWVEDEIALTPQGWAQQQSLTKSVFVPTVPPLVRESGLVSYQRSETLDVAAARAYWNQVGPYWAEARAAWGQALRSRRDLKVFAEANGQVRWRRLFAVVDAAVKAGVTPAEARPRFDELMREYVERR